MNIDNINKTIEVIKNDKRFQFDMSLYMQHEEVPATGNECGTSCCLAGYATIAKYGNPKHVPTEEREDQYKNGEPDYFKIGQKFFDIDDDTAYSLFIPDGNNFWNNSPDDAVLALETLRDTGKVLWNDHIPTSTSQD